MVQMGRKLLTLALGLGLVFGTTEALRAQYANESAPPDQGQQYPEGPQDAQAQQDAQQGAAGQDDDADRQRGVARLSVAQGDVNVKRGDNGDLVAAVVNAPLMAQDHLQTSPGSRAEVQLDYANMIRLGPNTDLGFADLQYHRYQVQLGAGDIVYRVLRNSNAQAEVDTPSVAVRPTQEGDYRISVLDDGSTQITVRSGALEVNSPQGTQTLQAGRTMLVRGDSSDPQFQMTDAIAPDQLDDWSANRDRQLLASQSYKHVSSDIYGADDLDQYGNWVPSQYGNVWEPQNPGAGWAPYSNGQWVWEPYYGWTWVDSAPWGWAPYHYGRWFMNPGYGWCWWPGSVFSSYLWNPALVGFFGWGGGFGIGFGGLGWVALAPFEFFHPWWGHGWGHGWDHGFYGRGYGRGGYGNYANIRNAYRNASIRGAAITAPGNAFGRGRAGYGRATQAQLQNASLIRGQLPVRATQASYQLSNRQARPNPRLASASNRQFFQSQRSGQAGRGFSAQRAGSAGAFGTRSGVGNAASSRGTMSRTAPNMSRSGGVGGPSIRAGQPSLHGVPPNIRAQAVGRSGFGAPGQAGANGWHRFGEPGTSNAFRSATAPREQSGWHSFGQPQHTAAGSYGGARPGGTPAQSGYGRSFSGPNYSGNYQSRPLGSNAPSMRPPQSFSGYRGPGPVSSPSRPAYKPPQQFGGMGSYRSAPSMPHYSAPSAPHYSAPHYSAPHSSAPSSHGGGGGFHGGGGSSHGGGGGHSSSGGHHR